MGRLRWVANGKTKVGGLEWEDQGRWLRMGRLRWVANGKTKVGGLEWED